MEKYRRLYFMLTCNFIIHASGRLNMVMKNCKLCDASVDYPNKINVTIRTIRDVQYIDANATFRVPLDDFQRSNLTIELLVGKNYINVIKFEEKRTCTAMHRYFGEFIYNIERTGQLVPGLCPIPPGRYHLHNYTLNFNMMTLQNFPFGHLRMKEIATDNKNNNVIICVVMEVENLFL